MCLREILCIIHQFNSKNKSEPSLIIHQNLVAVPVTKWNKSCDNGCICKTKRKEKSGSGHIDYFTHWKENLTIGASKIRPLLLFCQQTPHTAVIRNFSKLAFALERIWNSSDEGFQTLGCKPQIHKRLAVSCLATARLRGVQLNEIQQGICSKFCVTGKRTALLISVIFQNEHMGPIHPLLFIVLLMPTLVNNVPFKNFKTMLISSSLIALLQNAVH